MPQTKIKLDEDVGDVNIAAPSDNDVLTYDTGSGKWVNQAPAAVPSALDDLTDVDAPAPTDGDVLTYDDGSGNWVNQAPSGVGGGHTIENDEVALTQRTKLDFMSPFVVTDDAGNDRTKVSASAAGLFSQSRKLMQTRTTLYSATLAVAGTFDVQNIDQSYTHLEITFGARAAANDDWWNKLAFNNDTTDANYLESSEYYGSGAGNATSNIRGAGYISANNAPSGQFARTMLVVFDYAKTDRAKHVIAHGFGERLASAGYSTDAGFVWRSNSAINRFTLVPSNGGNFAAGSILEIVGVKDEYVVTNVEGAGSQVMSATRSTVTETDYICIQDQKAQNTNGGTATTGAWRTRDLQTEVSDTGNNVTIAANQMTLLAGTYRVYITAPATGVHRHQARLYNVTDGSVIFMGSSEYTFTNTGYPVTNHSIISGKFTIASTKVLEVQHYVEETVASSGFGQASNMGTEVYTQVQMWKEKTTNVVTDVQQASGMVMYGKVLLFDQTLSVAGTFDVQNIDQSYDHLELRVSARSSEASVIVAGNMYFNNDTTDGNYRTEISYANEASGGVYSSVSPAFYQSGASSLANDFSDSVIEINNYAKTDRLKKASQISNVMREASSVDARVCNVTWNNVAAIARIIYKPATVGANWIAGSRLQVFGMKNMVTPVGQSSAFVGTQLFKQTLTVAQASFDFQNIPSGYDYLEVYCIAKIDSAASANLLAQFNGDTTATNYQEAFSLGGTSDADTFTNDNRIGYVMPSGQEANRFSHNKFTIHGYDRNDIHKVARSLAAYDPATTTEYTADLALTWRNTAPITRLTLLPGAGNLDIGSTCLIVGYKNTLIAGGTQYVKIQDQKSANTQGGTFTSGAWRTRDLNTIVNNDGTIATLAANQITLPAGTYRFIASAPAYIVNNHVLRLYNITDGAEIARGQSAYADASNYGYTKADVSGKFTITGTKVLEVQHRCYTTSATYGYGVAVNWDSAIEIYAQIEFWKEN